MNIKAMDDLSLFCSRNQSTEVFLFFEREIAVSYLSYAMVILAILWAFFYALHSILASLKVKAMVKERLPGFFNYYRIFYNALSLSSFILIFIYQESLAAYPIAFMPAWAPMTGYVFVVAGLFLIGAAIKNYNAKEFFGFKQMSEFNPAENPFVASGLNAYVRHPLYFGIIVALLGYLLIEFDYKTLTFVVISLIYLVIGATLEERKLILLYGDQYLEYKRKVRMLIPFI